MMYPYIYESFHIPHVISLLSRENKNSQLTSLPMCSFIAQLVEHRTGIAEVTASNPVEALIFFSGFAPNVWLHSSVGRASHRYRGGHGFESR